MTMKKFQPLGTLLLAAFVLALTAACVTPAPSIQAGPDAELSFDGLHKVDNSQADAAWARADFDISRYTKLMLISSGFEYRDVTNRGRTQMERSRGGPFYIDQDRRARFEQLVADIFAEDFQQIENFEIVSEPGPDVMIVRGALLDIVTYVPPTEGVAGNIDIYLSNIGEATLVLELRDSETGTILARSVDRRAAERMGGQMMQSNRVTNTAEVRRLIRFWSQRLREGLDGFVEQAASSN
jgi:hypothetical protein